MKLTAGIIIAIIVLAATMIYSAYRSSLSRRHADELSELLVEKNFREFDRKANDPKISGTVPPFNLDYMKLQSYMLRGDTVKIDQGFDRFLKVGLNRQQKETVSIEAFTYYMQKRNKEKAKVFLDMMNASSRNADVIRTSNDAYGIIFEKKTDRLEEMIRETEELPEGQREFNEYLISVMYRNLGDRQKAEEYEKRYQNREERK